MSQRLLVITPVRNESAQIAKAAAGMRRQTRPPDRWIVIDDGSTDDTPAVLESLVEEVNFMEIRRARRRPSDSGDDHLAAAAEARAFNDALELANLERFSHIAKLDGDVELPSSYFQELLSQFHQDPRLGLAGGALRESIADGQKVLIAGSDHHVGGALKCYSTECLEAIGGIHERLAWDTIDEISARMLGFRTRTFEQIVALHHCGPGGTEGLLRSRARNGRCHYITHYPIWWVALWSLRSAAEHPRGLSGIAFLGGYLRAAAVRELRVQDPAFRIWVRRELAARAVAAARLGKLAVRLAPESRTMPGSRRGHSE